MKREKKRSKKKKHAGSRPKKGAQFSILETPGRGRCLFAGTTLQRKRKVSYPPQKRERGRKRIFHLSRVKKGDRNSAQ